MRSSGLSFTLLLFATLATLASALDCTWEAPGSGHTYDFSGMRASEDFTSNTDDYTYTFNPCGDSIDPLCAAGDQEVGPGSMCQLTGDPQKLVAVLGAWTEASGPSFQLINPKVPADGLQIIFNNGDTNNCARKVLLNVTCGAASSGFEIFEDPDAKCNYLASMEHPVACIGGVPGGGLSGGWIFIIIVSVTSIVYVAAGCVYKNKKLQTTGMESCPQIDFWRELPGLCKEGVSFTIAKIKGCFGKGGNDGPSGGFDEI
jgi:hypothetical protein